MINRRTSLAAIGAFLATPAYAQIFSPSASDHLLVAPPLDPSFSKAIRIAHDTPILQSMMEFIRDGKGRSAMLSPGAYLINEPLEYLVMEDRRANAAITGRGRGATQIVQNDINVPVFDLGTTSGNLRGLEIAHMKLSGGSRAIRTAKTVYNVFHHLELSHGRGDYVLEAVNASDLYSHCWFPHSWANVLYQVNGTIRFATCRFGEDCGALWAGGNLIMNNCYGHNLTNKGEFLGERSWIFVSGGGSLNILGGNFEFKKNGLDSVVLFKNSRDIIVNNTTFEIRNTPRMFDNHGTVAWASNYKGTEFSLTNGVVTATGSANLEMYYVDRIDRDTVHRGAEMTPTVKIKSGSLFKWGVEFVDPVYGNSIEHSSVIIQ